MHNRSTVIKLLLLGLVAVLLILLPAITADAANDVASGFSSNGTAIDLTATWTEYANISVATGVGNVSISITVNTATNYSTARSYGRIKRDGTVLESFNLSQSYNSETTTFVAPATETEGTHYYTFESWCTSGKKCTLYNRTFSVIFVKTGSFAASVTNVTATSPITSTHGSTPNIAMPMAGGSQDGYLDQTNWTKFNNTNTTATTHTSQISTSQSNDTVHNSKFDFLNTSKFNSSNTTDNLTEGVTNLWHTTARVYSVGNITYIKIGNATTCTGVGRSVWNGTWFTCVDDLDEAVTGGGLNISGQPIISANATLSEGGGINLTQSGNTITITDNRTNYPNNTVANNIANWNATNATAVIESMQAILNAMNQSSATNNTASQGRDDAINLTKLNKTELNSTVNFTNGNANNLTSGTMPFARYMNDVNSSAQLTSSGQVTGLNGTLNEKANKTNISEFTGGTVNISLLPATVVNTSNQTYPRTAVSNGTSGNLTYNSTTGVFDFLFTGCTTGQVLNVSSGLRNLTCQADSTSQFSITPQGGSAITGSAVLNVDSTMTVTQNGNNINLSVPAAGVTNGTVNPHSFNLSNGTGNLNYSHIINVTVNLTNGTNVTGLLPDANLASTFVKTVGATSPCTSSGGQNPSITCTGVSNATVDFQTGNASNITRGVLSNASAPLSSVNRSTDFGAWTDYNETSTIVGWSSFTQKFIVYKQINKMVFVKFNIRGTSNSTSATFTLPVSAFDGAGNRGQVAIASVIVEDNSTYPAIPGMCNLPDGDNVMTCYKDNSGATWTASGSKQIFGEFFYETN